MRRRYIAIIFVIVLLLIVLTTVFFIRQARNSGSDMNNSSTKTAIKQTSQPKKEGLAMQKIPNDYRQRAAVSQRGSVQSISYKTTYRGKSYPKRALVYLPAGYEANLNKKYNILYLLHGAGMPPSAFLGGEGRDQTTSMKVLLDHMIADKRIDPMIVVAPNYYPDRSFMTGNYYDDGPLNRAFAQHELTHDLMPTVESRYHTYAKSTSNQAFIVSRAHRVFGGFSMGAITTWFVFEYHLPYFRYFMPMAGDSWTEGSDGGGNAPRQTADRLAQVVADNNYQAKDFLISASVGGADGTSVSMSPMIRDMHRLHGTVFTSQNLLYRTDPGGGHDERSFINQAYNSLPLFFSKNK